jgi:photosystem II stability/assembly factor-like uncharacterized protein
MGDTILKPSPSFFVAIFLLVCAVCINQSSAQWEKIPDLEYVTIYCMLTTSGNTIFVGGDAGTLLRSTDNGSTWTNVMGNGFWVDTVLSLGQGLGYIFAGANGAGSMYRSSNNGENWNPANIGIPPNASLHAFTFAEHTLFAATNYGIYSSADSGRSWIIDTTGLGLTQMYPTQGDGLAGIVAGGSMLYTIKWKGGIVYSSPTNSIFWEQISSEFYYTGLSITAIDTNIFIATQKGIYLYGGGTTWLPRNNGLFISDTSRVDWCIFTNSDSILFANILSNSLYTSGIYFTSDFGQNWKKLDDSVFTENSINTISVNKNYLFAAAQNGGWRMPLRTIIPVELTSFTAVADANNLILNWLTATETNNLGFEILRSGQQMNYRWENIGFVKGKGTTSEQQTYSFIDINLSAGEYQYKLKQIDFDGTYEYSNIIKVNIKVPNEFLLIQNYPNPFNPITKIKYAIGSMQFAILKIYDVLGNEVSTLVNEVKPAGEYEIEFDGSNLSSGTYFYKLQAGDFVEIKKLLLLK